MTPWIKGAIAHGSRGNLQGSQWYYCMSLTRKKKAYRQEDAHAGYSHRLDECKGSEAETCKAGPHFRLRTFRKFRKLERDKMKTSSVLSLHPLLSLKMMVVLLALPSTCKLSHILETDGERGFRGVQARLLQRQILPQRLNRVAKAGAQRCVVQRVGDRQIRREQAYTYLL